MLEAQFVFVLSEPSNLMCLDTECHRCAITRAVGRVGAAGVGGSAGVVGRRRCHRGCGWPCGGRSALFAVQPLRSGNVYVPERQKLTCLNMSIFFLQNFALLFTIR